MVGNAACHDSDMVVWWFLPDVKVRLRNGMNLRLIAVLSRAWWQDREREAQPRCREAHDACDLRKHATHKHGRREPMRKGVRNNDSECAMRALRTAMRLMSATKIAVV